MVGGQLSMRTLPYVLVIYSLYMYMYMCIYVYTMYMKCLSWFALFMTYPTEDERLTVLWAMFGFDLSMLLF